MTLKFFYAPSDSSSESDEDVEAKTKRASKGAVDSGLKARRTTTGKYKQRQSGFTFTYESTSSSSSSSSAASQSEESQDELDEDRDLSETDSEEEEFPVELEKRRDSRRRLAAYPPFDDPLDVYHAKEQQKAWQRAQAAHNKDLAALRTIRLNAFTKAATDRKKAHDDEVELVRLVLQDFDLRRQQEEERIDREFKQRNKERWDEINAAIAELERKQKLAEQAKQKQLQAEADAKKLRDQEQDRIAKEEEAKKQAEQEKQTREAALREQARKAAEERAKNQEQEVQKAPTTSASGTATPTAAAGHPYEEARLDFEKWHSKIQAIKRDVLPAISANSAWRNACRTLKRGLSTRVSNISASAEDVRSKAADMHQLLNDSKATPQTYTWALNLLSKRIIGMASANTEADQSGVPYALAQVVIALLCADHVELADIFMARLVKRCPYVLPYYPSRGQMPLGEFTKLIGRKGDEATINYNQRMAGILALYAAIVQTSPSSVPQLGSTRNVQNVPQVFRPARGWRWLAMIVRPPLPVLDVTPLLLFTFLRMVGERFHQLYGRQFVKLIQALAVQGIDEGKVRWNKEVQGDLSKVRILVGEWLEKGIVKGAEGRLPA